MLVHRLGRKMFAAVLVAAAVVLGSRLGASVAVAANGRPVAATRGSLGNPHAVPPILASATQCAPAAGFPAASTPVAFWSTEARCAIVPPTAGAENFGNKFPGEAALYMGIVHVAIYDAAVAVERRLPAVSAHTRGADAHLARGRDRGGNARHPRRATAGARPQCRPAGDPRQRLRRLSGGNPRRHGEDERTRRRPADRGSWPALIERPAATRGLRA